jgi:phosphoribosylformylglycinamidine (FGAM) synthase-like enzyme
LWDALHELHQNGKYVSGSAIAEGGIALRVFEAAYGSGLGASIDLAGMGLGFGEFSERRKDEPGKRVPDPRYDEPRKDGLVFGEFIGSVILEVPPDLKIESFPGGVIYTALGEVISEPKLQVSITENILWQESVANLAKGWSSTFLEVVK